MTYSNRKDPQGTSWKHFNLNDHNKTGISIFNLPFTNLKHLSKARVLFNDNKASLTKEEVQKELFAKMLYACKHSRPF